METSNSAADIALITCYRQVLRIDAQDLRITSK